MNRIALVTDSTSDLTKDMQAEFGAHIVRLKVVFGEQVYYDGDLSAVDFYFRLLQAQNPPSTPPPDPEDFVSLYNSLLEQHDEVISIHLSEGLSRTIAVAREARDIVGAANRIHIVDSGFVSVATAMQVAEAARGIRKGLDTREILATLKAARDNTETMMMLDTLTFLRRGRRIGRLKGMIASFLNVKPLVRINDEGVFEAAGRAKDQTQALETIVKYFQEKAAGRRVLSFAVAHGSAREPAQRLKKILEQTFDAEVSFFSEVGPAVGVHVGPGVFGAALRFA